MCTTTFMARPHFDSGALVPLMLDWCADTIPIHVVYPPNRHLSTKLRVFVDWAADPFARSDLIQTKCCLPKPTATAETMVAGGTHSPEAVEATSALSTYATA